MESTGSVFYSLYAKTPPCAGFRLVVGWAQTAVFRQALLRVRRRRERREG